MGASASSSGELTVRLNVYDLGHVSKWVLNSWASRFPDIGVYHVGVEVLGVEFCFQALEGSRTEIDTDRTGLTWHYPKSHPRHVFRESVPLGTSRLKATEIQGLLKRMEPQWSARSYNPINRNCVDFAEQFVQELQTSEPFPAWVHGLAKGLARNTSLADLPGLSALDCSKSSAFEAERSNLLHAFCNSGGAQEAGLGGALGALLRGPNASEAERLDGDTRVASESSPPMPRTCADRLHLGLANAREQGQDSEAVNVQCRLMPRR